MKRKAISALAVALCAALCLAACVTTDLRSDGLAAIGARPDDASAARGQALLEALAQRHGHAAWANHQTAELLLRDDWDSALAWMMGLQPWDEEDLLRLRYQPGTFNARVDFLEGPRQGEVRGLQSWVTYGRDPDQRDIAAREDDEAAFMLPAQLYLVELPFRALQATLVAYDGEAELEGRRYERVLVTWGSLEPHAEHDQYLLWIDQETGLLGLVDYTVRDQGSFFQARAFYGELAEVQGVTLARRLTVMGAGASSTDAYLHQVRVEEARFDSFPRDFLAWDAALGLAGDIKPPIK